MSQLSVLILNLRHVLQHADIREWLEHHLRLGVGKFYIFDNSTLPMLPAFADLVRFAVQHWCLTCSPARLDNRLPLESEQRGQVKLSLASWGHCEPAESCATCG